MVRTTGSPFNIFARRSGRVPAPAARAPRPGAATSEGGDGLLCGACAKEVEPEWKFCANCGQAVGTKPDDDENDDEDDDEDDNDDGELAAVRRRATARCLAIYSAGVRLNMTRAAIQVLGGTTLGRKSAIRLLESMAMAPGRPVDAAAQGKIAAQAVLASARLAGILPTPPAANDPRSRR